jgi:hypothetical protein
MGEGDPTNTLANGLCALFMLLGGGTMMLLKWYNQQEEENGWGRAPGLRRLMNDQDEGSKS